VLRCCIAISILQFRMFAAQLNALQTGQRNFSAPIGWIVCAWRNRNSRIAGSSHKPIARLYAEPAGRPIFEVKYRLNRDKRCYCNF
jgi:hypothetical protein